MKFVNNLYFKISKIDIIIIIVLLLIIIILHSILNIMEITGLYSFLAASLGGLLTVKLYDSNKKQKIKTSNKKRSGVYFEKNYNLQQIVLIAKQRGIDHLLDEEEWKVWHIRKKINK